MSTQVTLSWKRIRFVSTDTWKTTEDKLDEAGINLSRLRRSVYVIRSSRFAIAYPIDNSPVLYIGEGDFQQRFESHRRSWVAALSELMTEFPLEAYVCCPRVPNNTVAHRVLEAHLLNVFKDSFGSLPLRNLQNEYAAYDYNHEYDPAEVNKVLRNGRGKTFAWALKPMSRNPLYDAYEKTHTSEYV